MDDDTDVTKSLWNLAKVVWTPFDGRNCRKRRDVARLRLSTKIYQFAEFELIKLNGSVITFSSSFITDVFRASLNINGRRYNAFADRDYYSY